jgi:hypothetical protein
MPQENDLHTPGAQASGIVDLKRHPHKNHCFSLQFFPAGFIFIRTENSGKFASKTQFPAID